MARGKRKVGLHCHLDSCLIDRKISVMSKTDNLTPVLFNLGSWLPSLLLSTSCTHSFLDWMLACDCLLSNSSCELHQCLLFLLASQQQNTSFLAESFHPPDITFASIPTVRIATIDSASTILPCLQQTKQLPFLARTPLQAPLPSSPSPHPLLMSAVKTRQPRSVRSLTTLPLLSTPISRPDPRSSLKQLWTLLLQLLLPLLLPLLVGHALLVCSHAS